MESNSLMTKERLEDLLPVAMEHAAGGLSEMVGHRISIEVPKTETIPIGRVAEYAGGPEVEMVGIYLLIDGEMPGQAILMAPLADALRLADMLLGEPEGTTTQLGDLERSALAEAGNLTVSYFLNEIASLTGMSSRPSPPAVMVDMLGAILDVVAVPAAAFADDLVIVETVFKQTQRTVGVHFWVLPFPVGVAA